MLSHSGFSGQVPTWAANNSNSQSAGTCPRSSLRVYEGHAYQEVRAQYGRYLVGRAYHKMFDIPSNQINICLTVMTFGSILNEHTEENRKELRQTELLNKNLYNPRRAGALKLPWSAGGGGLEAPPRSNSVPRHRSEK